MPNLNQDTLIQNLLHQTEDSLKKAIEWQLIPHSEFARRPSAEKWSANECLQHLNSYGRYYLPAIEKTLNRTSATKSSGQFSPGWLGAYFTKLMLPSSNGRISKKMKSPKDHVPKTIIDSHVVMTEFIDQQEKVVQLLRRAQHIDLNANRVGISIAPFVKLKLGDVFMFLIAHIQRHILQAERSLDKLPVMHEK